MRTARFGLIILTVASLMLAGCGILGGGEPTTPPPATESETQAPIETPAPPTAVPATVAPTAHAGDVLFVNAGQVWAVGADGAGLRQLTILPGSAVVDHLTVSPDGKFAGYTINRTLAEILELASGTRTTLDFANKAQFDALAWATDSSAVYFHKVILNDNSAPSKSQIWKVALLGGGAPERVTESDLATGPMAIPQVGLDGGRLMIHEFAPGGDAGNWQVYDPAADASTPFADGFGVWDSRQGRTLLFSKTQLTPGHLSVPIALFGADGESAPVMISPADDDQAAYTAALYGRQSGQIAALRYTMDSTGAVTSGAAVLQAGDDGVYQLTTLAPEPGTRDVAVIWADATYVVVQRLRGDTSELWLVPVDGTPGSLIATGEQPAVVGG